MNSTTLAIVFAIVAFALFFVIYVAYGVRRGKAEGKTARTWCMPVGHGDIDVRTASGQEIAPADTCEPKHGEDVRRSA